ncbi:MAG: hypothetical protein ACTSWP_05470 [Candidatus Freyarchaeota archaeon]
MVQLRFIVGGEVAHRTASGRQKDGGEKGSSWRILWGYTLKRVLVEGVHA